MVIGLDRSAITQPAGSLLGGILRVTDSLGHLEVNVPVSGGVGSNTGLWIGEAMVTQVNQYLKSYAPASSSTSTNNTGSVFTNNLEIAADGSYVVRDINSDMTDVPKSFPLRLIVHSPDTGPAALFQRIFYGLDAYSNSVISKLESVLDPERLDSARRVSAVHLPWSPENEGWMFDGALEPGSLIEASVETAYNDQRSNPFLHTYHPDHDNLDSSFGRELAQGSESYAIERALRLRVSVPGSNFMDRVSVGSTLFGHYEETVDLIGLARAGGTNDTRNFEVRGYFKLDRVSDIPVISDPLQ